MRTKTIALLIVGVLLFAGGFLGIGAESALLIRAPAPPVSQNLKSAGVGVAVGWRSAAALFSGLTERRE